MRFRNPQNGYVEEGWTSISWLWCFLLGPLYLVGRDLWGPAFIAFFLNAAAYSVLLLVQEGVGLFLLCVVNFSFAARVHEMVTSYYLRKGWIEVKEKEEENSMDQADIALSVMQKVDNEQEEQSDKFIEGCRKHLL